MLITSLLMSINQLLPVVILWVLLHAIVKLSQKELVITLLAGLLSSFIYVHYAASISQLFDHRGVEFSQIALCGIMFVAALLACQQQRQGAVIAMISVMIVYLSHYMIYLISFWQTNETAQPLLIGTALGLGICFSFGTLFYFLLDGIKQRFGNLPLIILLAMNAAAKTLIALDLASQIDLANITASYVDWRGFLVENSELGRVLKALIGYEATPSKTAIWLYTIAMSVFLFISWLLSKRNSVKEPI
ncbi:hypothetical protein [Pseudoalteromonas prydzensis]|uniref:hypothetical protein n=1 Tax=Pseudoalteromonas prydzensis TaxID=182141 RepID=UPI0007E51581|nr:hypothetical protein [Pseudoalteromonas prydzensis]MBE0379893.1 hypothetical protein [Pseudoalteromonas prydzensis ACAM 620]